MYEDPVLRDRGIPELFADEIGSIGFSNGVVRIDLVSQAPGSTAEGGGRPQTLLRQRLVIPVEGFLRSLETMEELVSKLEKAGVVKRTERKPEPVIEERKEEQALQKTVSNTPSPSGPVHSPNFTE